MPPSDRARGYPPAAREVPSSAACLPHVRGCFRDRTQNSIMRPAAADVAVERLRDFGPRRRRIAVEQCLRRDEDAAEAIAALAGLLIEESLLQGMRLFGRAETLDGRDRFAGEAGNPA